MLERQAALMLGAVCIAIAVARAESRRRAFESSRAVTLTGAALRKLSTAGLFHRQAFDGHLVPAKPADTAGAALALTERVAGRLRRRWTTCVARCSAIDAIDAIDH
jgi:hypothetical protein